VAQFSFRLKRFCTGPTQALSSFNGVSLPGSQIGNTTYFSLAPSCVSLRRRFLLWLALTRRCGACATRRQVSTSLTCDPNAACTGGGCVCNPGFVGDGLTCTGTSAGPVPCEVVWMHAGLISVCCAGLACAIAGTCRANFACPGGNACGTTCNAGFYNNGTDCLRACEAGTGCVS
jgi:hypothetical protein